MCGRYVSATPPDQLAAYFDAGIAESLVEVPPAPNDTDAVPVNGPNFNVAPTTKVPVVVVRPGADDPARMVDRFRWGLIPFWAKDAKIGNKMINARSETAATKNAFRSPFKKRRCIIPADGFYEWFVVGKTDKGKPVKQPMYITRRDGAPFAFGGLWGTWDDPEGETITSCTILTGAPNSAMAKIHDRMPIMLPPSAWEQWLDPAMQDPDVVSQFLVPAPSELLTMHPVSTQVNNPRNKGDHLVDPIDVPDLPLGV